MSQKQLIILVVTAALAVLAVVMVVVLVPDTTPEAQPPDEDVGTTPTTVNNLEENFVPEVPIGVKETKPDETIQVITNPERNETLGGYTVVAGSGGYSPGRVVVAEGNIVRLTLKSEGGDYDLSIPAMSVYLYAPDGEQKQTSFRVPQSGTFKMECRDYCPTGKTISGQLIVLP